MSTDPPASRRLGDVLSDLDKWEGTLNEFYQCGGATVPEATKVMISMGTLPASTNSSIRLALKGIYNYASFKDTLRDNIRFLEEHGGTSGAQAHLLQDSQGNVYPHMWPELSAKAPEDEATASHTARGPEGIDLDALIAQAVNMSREGHDDETVLAVARGYARQPSGYLWQNGSHCQEVPRQGQRRETR